MKKKATPKQAKAIIDDPFYRLENKISKMFQQQDERARNYRDQILTKMDGVMGELENHRIEHEAIKNDIKSLKKHFTN